MPNNALLLTQYDELDQLVRAFAAGKLNLLIIVGRAGVQKSTLVRTAVGSRACWIESNATAFGLYCQLFRRKHAPVVIDDVDTLYADRACVRLLKSLCQTEPRKRIAWHTQAAGLDQQGIPREFYTTSRVVILANDWRSLNANVAAVEDRGHLVQFEPTTLEVHIRTAQWFWDQEIYDFVGQHLHLAVQLSMRDYGLSWELKQAGLRWQKYLLQRWGISDKLRVVVELKADTSFQTEEDRVRAFVAHQAGSRTTYFNLAKKLRPPYEQTRLIVAGKSPQTTPAESWVDVLQRRHGGIGEG